MSSEESDAKTCNRCGYVWNSYAEKPIRCPGCGTYHWHEVPITNTCIMCGHKWFSRTTQIPIRCPKCKTRSWRDGEDVLACGHVRKAAYSFDTGEIAERYDSGQGCVSIAMDMNLSMEKVISVLRSEMGDCQLKM